jgi:O-acetylhomoserine (thiol)-lyase
MSRPKYPDFDTLALHAGGAPDPETGARATPIYLTTSFVFPDSDHAAALFNMERSGHVYSRISNPTNAVLEERIAALENGVGAIATASGQAALHLAVATLAGAGSHIVASRALYGGSHNLLHFTMKRFGIETTFVNPRDLDEWKNAIRPNTKLLFGETLGNPGLDVLDIPRVSAIAHDAKVPLLVDGGTFDWHASGKFPELTEPYAGFHNMVFAEESTVAPFLLRARREGLRDFGAVMSPFTAFQILQGIETLSLRMERHVANTRRIVEFLSSHKAVASVSYPELPEHPDHALAKTLLPNGCGAVFSFSLKGDRAAGVRFVEALKIFSHLANVGDAKSLVIHPASTTHFRVAAADLAAAGITEGTMRLSIGLESADDLIDDLEKGLRAAMKG